MQSSPTPLLDVWFGRLSRGLQDHVRRAQRIADDLARRHGADPERASLATYCHDLARSMGNDELLQRAREWDIPVKPAEEALPFLLHGPVGAEMVRREAGVTDSLVLEAVRWHTTLGPGVGVIAKIVYLADKLDPQKLSRYVDGSRLQALAQEDLDAAVLALLDQEISSLLAHRGIIHPAAIEARNELLVAKGKK